MVRNGTIITEFKSRRSRMRRVVIKIVFLILGRATQSASRHEPLVREEAAPWPEGFTMTIRTLPDGPILCMQKRGCGIRVVGREHAESADLAIDIRTVRAAFRMFTARLSIHDAYAEHRIGLHGNVSHGIRFIRIMGIIQSYLFPRIISSKILKHFTPMTPRRLLRRVWIVLPGLLFGI